MPITKDCARTDYTRKLRDNLSLIFKKPSHVTKGKILAVDEEKAVVDFNSPFTGQEIIDFEIQVVCLKGNIATMPDGVGEILLCEEWQQGSWSR